MFIKVMYKDPAELSSVLVNRRSLSEADPAEEKTLLVNSNCPIRIILEYIRDKCHLGYFSQFDLCDDQGKLLNLFSLPNHEYALDKLEPRSTYYIVVFKAEGPPSGAKYTIFPQISRDNLIYLDLRNKIRLNMQATAYDATSLPRSPLADKMKLSSKVLATGFSV